MTYHEEQAPQPDKQFTINNIETLRVASDPLRIQILEALAGQPQTVKQVAIKLKVEPKKLYYHINMLEEHGLIRITSTHLIANMLERHYQIRARFFRVDDSLLAIGTEVGDKNLDNMLSFVFDDAKHTLKQSAANGLIEISPHAPANRRMLARHGHYCLTLENAGRFYAELEHLLESLSAANDTAISEDSQWYDVVLGMYPIQLDTTGE